MSEYSGEIVYDDLQAHELSILTEFFKMLGDPTRIHLLFLLMEQDACVSDLAKRMGMTQTAVSHQLSLLKANKLVRQRRSGKMIIYTLVDNHVRTVIEKGTEHVLFR